MRAVFAKKCMKQFCKYFFYKKWTLGDRSKQWEGLDIEFWPFLAYGCYNGSVRLYFPASKSVKTLGTHSAKVLVIDITIETITISPDENVETTVVVSGCSDGLVKIWWDIHFYLR